MRAGLRFGGVIAVAALAAHSARADDAAAIAKARDYFEKLRAGEYAACVEVSSEAVRAGLPADKLEAVWAQITAAYGAYESERSATVTVAGEFQVVDLASKFARGNLRVRISIDGDGRIGGLFFTPLPADEAYQPPAYVNTQGFRNEAVTVDAGGWPLAGTLTLPNGAGPFPAVVLVHGSGPHDQDESIYQRKPFRDLAGGLASRGIAVLRYEKRTHKYGDRMKPAEVTIDTETTDDAIAGARLLLTRRDIDSNGVYVLGHSLGATAAPYIGGREPRVAGVVMVAAAALPLYELVTDQVAYLANVDGTVSADEQEQIDAVHQAVAKLRTGQVEAADTLLGAPCTYWRDVERLAPIEHAQRYARPMLLVFGGRDYQVSVKESDIWQRELKNTKNAEIHILPALDHLMHAGEGPSKPIDYTTPGYVDEQVVVLIADWIKAHAS